jgi:hypothetical protein
VYLKVFDDLGKWITCDYFLSFRYTCKHNKIVTNRWMS